MNSVGLRRDAAAESLRMPERIPLAAQIAGAARAPFALLLHPRGLLLHLLHSAAKTES
jgi:hypothetical protein